ncbi:hypothetical protein HMPREF9719_01082 [Corynebacterium otitidis ATCC 51513]|uniref:Uncharacterized protein n=2 Tax=Corynebacterium otitidis TaxID=29321 RepID=I7L8G8_9CORY|nr:hypothetical protein HMPREF9719_01082 [Corynebacterium otitidis ATCC 51513]KKO83320.1 hypothetical protein AAV33_07135 [Corynebacterium otitidis]CCI83217.1 hypothetical protein BN46_0477 [Corynebacterium otitidis ATCC 51513]
MMGTMASKETQGYVDPAWPKEVYGGGHAVTELESFLAGASSPFGDDLVLPRPSEDLGYVHPYTRINKEG